ncbi:MAG TPA: hypothetical protein VK914_01880 [bacterium]|nr:hypothetical protein [bacterium]
MPETERNAYWAQICPPGSGFAYQAVTVLRPSIFPKLGNVHLEGVCDLFQSHQTGRSLAGQNEEKIAPGHVGFQGDPLERPSTFLYHSSNIPFDSRGIRVFHGHSL